MATYWISFKIGARTVNGKTYQERWDGLYDCVEMISSRQWKDTTSFIMCESTFDIDLLASAIEPLVSRTYDLVLIKDLDNKSARMIGEPEDDQVFNFLSFLQYA